MPLDNNNSTCYSTCPIEQAKINDRKPKNRGTDKQNANQQINDCRRFSSTYAFRVELQKTENAFNGKHQSTKLGDHIRRTK